MSFHWCDNIHTTIFTPRDYQVELLAAAFEHNTMICLGHKSSKEFIALKLLQELTRESRNKGKISLYITCQGSPSMYTLLKHLTDLKVFQSENFAPATTEEKFPSGDYQVYIIHPQLCLQALRCGDLSMADTNLLIIEDCHEAKAYREILPIFGEFYKPAEKQMPKVLGLAGPLHSAECSLQELGAMLNKLERNVKCRTETASDIVTVLRYCSKPIEYVVQCAPHKMDELTAIIEDILKSRKSFLLNHRYDPFEIYNSEEFAEELKDIPDPKREPLDFLDIMLNVLHEMGPWCADRVTVNMFHRIEKQKIKTPHERHYILLCLVNTALLEIHSICEQTFRKYASHKEVVEMYSSPKVLRLLEILRLFKPDEFASDNEMIKRVSLELEQMDFQKLQRNLEYSCQSVENIVKQQIESQSIIENLDPILVQSDAQRVTTLSQCYNVGPSSGGGGSRLNDRTSSNGKTESSGPGASANRRYNSGQGRNRRKPFTRRHFRDNSDAFDSLCAIVFCTSSYSARVLFELLAEMSRHDPDLKFLKCQYTTDRIADPLTEPKEAEAEHRRQEEVLKRFRTHDCNVLIGTSVLEEGIDVPKCNLVVRWDPPTTYRSYVQCKGRARASPAYHVILVAPNINTLAGKLNEQSVNVDADREQLSESSHQFLCRLPDGQSDIDSDEESNEDSDDAEFEKTSKSNQFTIGSSKGTVKILNPEVITYQPPTKTGISLKEIKDETLAIEENKEGKEELSLKELEDVEPIKDEAEEEKETTSNKSSCSSVTEKPFEDCYEVLNLSENQPETPSSPPTPVFERQEAEVEKETTSRNSSATSFTEKSFEDCYEVLNLSEYQPETPTPVFAEQAKPKRKFKCEVETPEEAVQEGREESYKMNLRQMENITNQIVDQMAQYREMEKTLLEKCANLEPPEGEHLLADEFTPCLEPYKPLPELLTGASVDLSSSIALVNKYCSKLPSDTFTKLTALWRCCKATRRGTEVYQYTIRLPINSPLKYDIVGLPIAGHILARRLAAMQACMQLHKTGELDDNLQPIGKEGFRAIEPDWENFELEEEDEKIVQDNSEPRPGTTKRRQYYYKRIASEFCDCRPMAGAPCFLYFIDLSLQCPIPEEQNTRGRKIYPPEEALQGFGILTRKRIPKVSSFPIFTRSGEVKVSLVLAKEQITLTEEQIVCINTFLNYTFTKVLRLQKFLMLFDSESTENCVFIVPTVTTSATEGAVDGGRGKVIDWQFLSLIEKNATMMPTAVTEDERQIMEFDGNRFKDAVVMPWYRNQDQPQYFYVAEICPQLSPLSCFPGENYCTFKHYYALKYGLTIQNSKQPLLDVDHTSARLNFLTPRYVNRKGVALPTSSEETKRAKRENLEQKQILVPELCTIHPFPASLWRTAVCLPCILYRINGLLLADDIRKKVSADIALGQQDIPEEFDWPMLDFGWSLSEVLRKSKEGQQPMGGGGGIGEQYEQGKRMTNGDGKERAEDVDVEADKENLQPKGGKSANEIVLEGEKKLQDSNFIEIGTWSNEMAKDIKDDELSDEDDDDDDDMEAMKYLPANVSFCDQQMRYGSPTFWDIKEKHKFKDDLSHTSSAAPQSSVPTNASRKDPSSPRTSFSYYDSDDSFTSSYDDGPVGGMSNGLAHGMYSSDDEDDDNSGNFRITFTAKNEAENVETAEELLKRQKQLSIIQATNANERAYQETKNLQIGYNLCSSPGEGDGKADGDVDGENMETELRSSIEKFVQSTRELKEHIRQSGMLVKYDETMVLAKNQLASEATGGMTGREMFSSADPEKVLDTFQRMIPYACREELQALLKQRTANALTVADVAALNAAYEREHGAELFDIVGCGDVFDNFNDKNNLQIETYSEESGAEEGAGMQRKRIKLNFTEGPGQKDPPINGFLDNCPNEITKPSDEDQRVGEKGASFSFDHQPDLSGHPGPSPSIILQALTMSNANDGINLERLETIGDSFLKYAITTYLYITYENVHEGKLSHLRSKQVANLNLYRLGRRKMLGEYMIATKFEPHDNWLPPCYYVPKELEKELIEAKIPPHHWKLVDLANIKKLTSAEICSMVKEKAEMLGLFQRLDENNELIAGSNGPIEAGAAEEDFSCFIPYNLVTQHSIPDKSVADCVEALIGAYLIECGSRGALLFMAWLGIRVLPITRKRPDPDEPRQPGTTTPDSEGLVTVYGHWPPPKSPLLRYMPNAERELDRMLEGFDEFERILGYKFHDRSYLLQAMTHASYSPNRLTDCYQRLEFLGDAVLDYLITRHLYEDPRQHSPGALTDLRSALVNNTIFASLAVRHGFHKYFRHLSPGLNEVIDRFVRIQNENGHSISEEFYLLSEEECDDAEDVEVPKALGDVFESVAGAIFLDSNMSLDVVWKVYSNMMKPEIEQFSSSVPKSPIRELLELEPETAKFGKPEKLADGRRVRVTVEVFCKGTFRGIGRNYRIAKCTAAKCALRQLKKQGLISKKD